jgi:pimeloyl-ACP methyl ester carboxylesterase
MICTLPLAAASSCDDLPLPPLPTAQQSQILGDCPVQAYCLRGLADVYSLGLNHLTDRLRIEGVNAEALSHRDWSILADGILARFQDGTLTGPVVMVGHSYGSDDAIRVAEFLDAHGVEVELLVLLDATIPPPIPANVARCLHLYQQTLWGALFPAVFAGRPVQPVPGNDRTEIINLQVTFENFGEGAFEVNHFNVDSSTMIHDVVIEEVVRVCGDG